MNLLLVDDHTLFREGLASLFSYQDDFSVVAEAGTGEEAIEKAKTLRPDLILMDIDLPGMDGISATRSLKAELPEIPIVILTVYDNTDKLFEAIKAGAQGYLVKNIRLVELLSQLRGLAHGEAAIERRLATRILEEFRRQDSALEPEGELTSREIEVLELVAARLANKEIAAHLGISEHTVKNHLKSILRKLHLRSRRQAAAYGIARGWVSPPDPRDSSFRATH